jgi:hypothetical protein
VTGCHQPSSSCYFSIFVAAALSRGTGIGFALLLHGRGSRGVSSTALYSPGALVRQAEERRVILDVMGDELLQHPLIPHTLTKYNHNKALETREWYCEPGRTVE